MKGSGPTDDDRKAALEFLRRMDAGEFDDNLLGELGKLTSRQRFELVELLIQRDENRNAHSA